MCLNLFWILHTAHSAAESRLGAFFLVGLFSLIVENLIIILGPFDIQTTNELQNNCTPTYLANDKMVLVDGNASIVLYGAAS